MSNMKLYFIILFDFLMAIIIFTANNYLNLLPEHLSWVSLFVSVCIIISFFPIKKGEGVTLTFIIIYIITTFGRAVLQYNFDYKPSTSYYNSFAAYTKNEISSALLLGVYSLIFLHLGMMLKRLRKKTLNLNQPVFKYNNYQIKALNMTGLILIMIGILPAIIEFYYKFTGRHLPGQDFNTIISSLSGLMLPSFIIFLITTKSKWFYYIGLLYYFPQLLWGQRGDPILNIVILTFVYYKYINTRKLKVLSKLAYLIGGVLTLNLFVVIKELRKFPTSVWIKDLPQVFIDTLFKSNPIFEIIYEVGVALTPVAATIKLVPEIIPVQYGKTIIYSIFTAIPDYFGIRPEIMSEYGNVSTLIATYVGSAFGGSMLQDFFINFMWFTPVLMIVIGYLVQAYSFKLNSEQRITKIVFYCVLLSPLFWWPRSSLGYMFRYIVTTTCLPIIIYLFFKSYFLKREVK